MNPKNRPRDSSCSQNVFDEEQLDQLLNGYVDEIKDC